MFCRKCGKQIDEDALFCEFCGTKIETEKTGYPKKETAYSGEAVSQKKTMVVGDREPMPKMKWFKFVIWVQLFINSLLNLSGGAQMLTGAIYGGKSTQKLVYTAWPVLEKMDFICALCCFLLAAAAIYVRSQLAKYKRNAPNLYLGFLIANIMVVLLYLLAGMIILKRVDVIGSTAILQMLVYVIMIFLNYIYFKKRAYLFCN